MKYKPFKQNINKHHTPPPFQAFTAKADKIVAQIIVPVRLSKAFDPLISPNAPFPLFDTMALWDTGATKSVITKATVTKIGLISTGNTMVNHAGGSSLSNTYVINVFLPNKVLLAGIQVSDCPDTAGNFGAIIGMDVISSGDLSISNVNNQTWISFRIPSYKPCDFVNEYNKIFCAGLQKYAPCPCGKKDNNGKPVSVGNCHGKDL